MAQVQKVLVYISPVLTGIQRRGDEFVGMKPGVKDHVYNYSIGWVVPPPRMPVTTRIVMFFVAHPYKDSFATVTGRGDNPKYRDFRPLPRSPAKGLTFDV